MTHSVSLVLHNIRSSLNVGAILRTAEGCGVSTVYLTGYSPYPMQPSDKRLPHLAQQITNRINKTALGAADSVNWEHHDDVSDVIRSLQARQTTIVSLEQAPGAVQLPAYRPNSDIAIILGNELDGVDKQLLELSDVIVEIPMFGKKESYNVAAAAAMVLYQCCLAQNNLQ